MKDAYIYGLKDPIKNKIRYIGKSDNPIQRYKHHLYSNYNNTKKECWIKSLKNKGLLPHLIIIEIVNKDSWQEREKYWIRFYKTKNDLVNGTDGGEGGKLSPENLASMIRKKTGQKINRKKLINSNNGRPLTMKHKIAISLSRKGKKRTDKENFIKCASLFSKKVNQYDLLDNFIRTWDSLKAVERTLGIGNGSISNVCSKKRKTAGGFKWSYWKEGDSD